MSTQTTAAGAYSNVSHPPNPAPNKERRASNCRPFGVVPSHCARLILAHGPACCCCCTAAACMARAPTITCTKEERVGDAQQASQRAVAELVQNFWKKDGQKAWGGPPALLATSPAQGPAVAVVDCTRSDPPCPTRSYAWVRIAAAAAYRRNIACSGPAGMQLWLLHGLPSEGNAAGQNVCCLMAIHASRQHFRRSSQSLFAKTALH